MKSLAFCAEDTTFARTPWADFAARSLCSSMEASAFACFSAATSRAVSLTRPQVSRAAPLTWSAAPEFAIFWFPMASPTPCLTLPAACSRDPCTVSLFICILLLGYGVDCDDKTVTRSSDRSPSRDQLDEKNYDGDEQKEVDVCSEYMESDEPE